mmetsp:Transcript_21359/g.35995  ORF Transcript_21359/g.35995 Transcript_21359/m.35995 type:complete len:367 (-) Transcript_21359:272-1372(-)
MTSFFHPSPLHVLPQQVVRDLHAERGHVLRREPQLQVRAHVVGEHAAEHAAVHAVGLLRGAVLRRHELPGLHVEQVLERLVRRVASLVLLGLVLEVLLQAPHEPEPGPPHGVEVLDLLLLHERHAQAPVAVAHVHGDHHFVQQKHVSPRHFHFLAPALHVAVRILVILKHFLEEERAEEKSGLLLFVARTRSRSRSGFGGGRRSRRMGLSFSQPLGVPFLEQPHVVVDGLVEEPAPRHPAHVLAQNVHQGPADAAREGAHHRDVALRVVPCLPHDCLLILVQRPCEASVQVATRCCLRCCFLFLLGPSPFGVFFHIFGVPRLHLLKLQRQLSHQLQHALELVFHCRAQKTKTGNIVGLLVRQFSRL